MKLEFTPRQVEVMHTALDTWGLNAQVDQTVEECAELIVALHKHTKREKQHSVDTRAAVLDEIADVEMLLGQMRVAFDISDDELRQHIAEKFEKLEGYFK